MGLIKAAVGALGGTLADQWREYVYCDSLPENVLAALQDPQIQTYLRLPLPQAVTGTIDLIK